MKVKYRVRCNKCSNYQEYRPRDIKKIPNRPDTKCNNCYHKIRINRIDLVDFINTTISKSGGLGKKRKSLRGEKIEKGKMWGKLEILKQLGQGLYAQEISRKGLFSPKKISQIIKWLKDNNFIVQTQKYPKKYNLTDRGKFVLKFPHFSKKDIKREKNVQEEKKILPDWVLYCRTHQLRFGNNLIQRPSWLVRISQKTTINGLSIVPVKMNNWTKYIVRFNYQQFNGLNNVEVGTNGNTIIYNFKKNVEDQLVKPGESIQNYEDDRKEECKRARAFLEQNGFVIDKGDPVLIQPPHHAFQSFGNSTLLGSLGQYVNLTIKTPGSKIIVDDSMDNGGEEETTDIKKAQSVLDLPQKIDNIHLVLNQIIQTQNNYNQIIHSLTKTQEKIALSLSQMTSAIQNIDKSQGAFV